jgi:hypothetical protein
MRKPSLFLLAAALSILAASRLQAQIARDIVADIPFPFHAGSARFAAGKYTLKVPVEFANTQMEIISEDGRNAAFFPVIAAQAGTTPEKPMLIFRKYGDDYFLWKVFDAGNSLGVEAPFSEDEKALSKGRTPEERRVGGNHQAR